MAAWVNTLSQTLQTARSDQEQIQTLFQTRHDKYGVILRTPLPDDIKWGLMVKQFEVLRKQTDLVIDKVMLTTLPPFNDSGITEDNALRCQTMMRSAADMILHNHELISQLTAFDTGVLDIVTSGVNSSTKLVQLSIFLADN